MLMLKVLLILTAESEVPQLVDMTMGYITARAPTIDLVATHS